MKNTEKIIDDKDKYTKSLLETIEIYKQKEKNNKLLEDANKLIELSYKAIIKEQRKIIIYLAIGLILSTILNFI